MATAVIPIRAVKAGATAAPTSVASGTTYTVALTDDPILLLITQSTTAGTATLTGEAVAGEFEAEVVTLALPLSTVKLAGPFSAGKFGELLSITVTQNGSLTVIDPGTVTRASQD